MLEIGIVGYGNLAKGVELALAQTDDMHLSKVFTRRKPEELKTLTESIEVLSFDTISEYKDSLDLLIICAGSADDLPWMSPDLAKDFVIVDSFDNHKMMPEHFAKVDKEAKTGDKLALLANGWDPGLFSIMRVYMEAVMPQGKTYTFWGRGVSQGHSAALRRLEGVKDAIQYTIPNQESMRLIRKGELRDFSTREKHSRLCYVVADAGADLEKIRHSIQTMPAYFADYDTEVLFISEEELKREHSGMPHGGVVLHSAKAFSSEDIQQTMEFHLSLDSNPEFTAQVLVAGARAVYRLYGEGKRGAISLLDIPPKYLITKSTDELLKEYL